MSNQLLRRHLRGQGIVEYAVLFAAVVGALALMALYVKHAVGGRWRSAGDSIGEQYDAQHTTSNLTTQITSTTTTTSTLTKDRVLTGGIKADVVETKTVIDDDTTIKTGSETVGAAGTDLWN